MAALDNAQISNALNAWLPTAAAGKPTAFTNLGTAAAMLLRYDSTAPSASAPGTQLTGTGYTAGGTALGQSTASTGGSNVTLPASTITITNGSGGSWTIVGCDVTDSVAARSMFGNFNGQPISVANGNGFQVAANGITASGS